MGYDEKGPPKTKKVLAKTKSECIEKLKALLSEKKESEPQTPQQNTTVTQWLDFWYQTHKKPTLHPNTQMSYEHGSMDTSSRCLAISRWRNLLRTTCSSSTTV